MNSPPLRRLLGAQIPADFADWLDYVAVTALLAFSWNADPYIFALLAAALGLPYLLIGPFAGVFVDRAPIKTVLIASNVGRAATTLMLAFAPSWQVLLPLIFLRSSVDAFYTPAKQAAIQALTESEQRQSVNGLSHAINQASKIAAPALGGALLISFAPRDVFLMNSLVSLLAALLLLRLPSITRPELSARLPMLAQIRAGLSLVGANRQLKGALSLMAAGFFAMFLYDTLIAPLARDFGFDAKVLGLTLAVVGGGGILGALGLGLSKDHGRPFLLATFGALIAGLSMASLWLAELSGTPLALWLFLAPFGLAGFATAMVVVPVRSVIQTETPPEQIASVTALGEALNTSALLVAPFVGAAIAHAFSIASAFLVGGGLMVLLAFYALWLHKHRGE